MNMEFSSSENMSILSKSWDIKKYFEQKQKNYQLNDSPFD